MSNPVIKLIVAINGTTKATTFVGNDLMTCEAAIMCGCKRLGLDTVGGIATLPSFDMFDVSNSGRRQIELLDDILENGCRYEFVQQEIYG